MSVLSRPHAASHHGTKTSEQFAEVERLDQIVIRAAVQSDDTIRNGILRRDHQNRFLEFLFSNTLQQTDPVAVGQHQIQQHHIDRFTLNDRIPRTTARRR